MKSLLSGLWAPLTLVVVAGALYAAGYVLGRQDGRQLAEKAIIERIVDQNERAGHDAELCRDLYRRCDERGGVFDFAGCACDR
jgi:hypothetical protein